ncbi:hypothetical protein EMIHUDRAFT_216203 [Emiliania huxleyi CCMP1516]|uniref:Uncharacterized protein n=2 Tax=Emiliania huxleyi TaxID=2903 RepID=A0A0D3IFL1_EMIH1|nr:hypothetical protein EMIHUDRAFT_216203 [Emiliania huxleyi CCMP1516]EOD10046.1 hypothetical protein EMIHUDRAFT_216203 [Emiliania huxleyi CCMP1516]|eukprot:XP_005762475.1 hypothetical protein EMIHUDRAFT_216203 [Emiliania huxleyi CCMP1516]
MLGASSTQPVDRQGGGAIWRSRPSALDLCRAPLPLVLLCGWWAVQIRADLLGLVRYGFFPHDAAHYVVRANPYWPFPELSMFAIPKSPNFVVSFALLSAVGGTYVVIATRAAVRLVAG